MIIKLDKGDTQEVFKEFVDEATKKYMDSKIKSLFNQRVEKVVKEKLKDIDFDAMIKGQIGLRIDKHFKSRSWGGEMDFANNRVDEHIKKIDLKKLTEDKFTSEVAAEVWNRMRLATKIVDKL